MARCDTKMTSLDAQKRSGSPAIKYKLRNATVYQSEDGHTFSKFLDNTDSSQRPVLTPSEKQSLKQYIKSQLESNDERFNSQINFCRQYLKNTKSILDIGCGGGAFLKKACDYGLHCEGVELETNRAEIARDESGCVIHEVDISSPSFIAANENRFDAVTLWDVIEHVNFPVQTITAARALLKVGGFLFIDTPAKDAFYHKIGDFTYRMTNGKYPTFLNVMYSERPFGHKQIFSSSEMVTMLKDLDFKIHHVEKFHEMSFPIEHYLKKLLINEYAAKALSPFTSGVIKIFPIKNKMLLCAEKLAAAHDV